MAGRTVRFRQMALRLQQRQRLLVGLIGVQAANAAFDAVALYPIAGSTSWGQQAKRWAKADLDRLGFPEGLRFVFPVVKTASVAGLLIGLRWRALGRITAAAIVSYFVAAVGFHARAKDPVRNYVPAVAMLVWACAVLRRLTSDGSDPSGPHPGPTPGTRQSSSTQNAEVGMPRTSGSGST